MSKYSTNPKFLYFVIILVITALLGFSLWWNIATSKKTSLHLAEVEANASYNKDVLYRRWASMHGGVYVPVSEFTHPNEILGFLPDRDIIIAERGDTLTLVNPAYMTRQVLEIADTQYGVKGHITSLNPIRKANKPDSWETRALMAFEKGVKDYSEIVTIDNKRFLRYMHPMLVEESCMKCHETQGYELGEIRGGVSVSVPLDKYDAIAEETKKQLAYTHGLIYLFVLFSSLWFFRRYTHELRRKEIMQSMIAESEASLKVQNEEIQKLNQVYLEQNKELQDAMASLKNEEAELLSKNSDLEFFNNRFKEIETRLEFALSSVNIGAWELDLADHTSVRTLEHDRIFGYKLQLESWTYTDFVNHVVADDRDHVNASFERAVANKDIWDFDCRIIRVDDEMRWIRATGRQVFDSDGRAIKMAGIVQDITELKNTEKELHHWQKLMEYVIYHDPSSIAVFDKNLHFIFVSEKFIRSYKLQGQDIVGKHHYDVFPDIPQKWREVHQRALKGEVMGNDDEAFYRADGSVDYTKWLCRPWHDANGEIGGIIIYTEVINDRKKAELELRKAKERAEESEEMLKQAQSVAKMGNWEYDIENHTVIWSDEIYRLLGINPGEFIPRSDTFLEFIHPEEVEEAGQVFARSLQSGEPVSYEHRIVTRNKETRYVLEKSETVFDSQNKPVKVRGIVIDITSLKKAEQTILQYGKVMDDSLNEIFIFDAHTLNFIMVNKGARNNLGYSTNEFLKMTPLDIKTRISLDEFREILQPLVNNERDMVVFNTIHTRKDKTEYPAEIHIQKAIFNNNPVFSVFVSDITERVKYENALKETNASLQDLVYVTSHDLQVPLVSMEGYASELLQNYGDKMDEEGLYCLTRLQANAQRMHKLVLSLLDLSRLNTVKNPYTTFNISQILDKIIKDLALTIEKHKVKVAFDDMPNMEADLQRIESVFRNLIVNSIVYEAKNIKIFYENHIIYFKDDGIGIPPDQLDRVFAPGERLKISKAEGVGMGLTFCKKVIDQHGGRIWAESEGIGKGATIAIDLSTNIIKH